MDSENDRLNMFGKNKKSISWKKYGDFGYQIRSISVIKRFYQRFLSSIHTSFKKFGPGDSIRDLLIP